MSNIGGYQSPGGNQVPVGSVYGKTPTQTPAWGGPNLRWGDTNPGVNAGYAAQAMPGTPFGYQQGFAATAGTPWSSNPNQYGRWNWAGQQAAQPQPGQPYQPPAPYQPPQQPAPYQPPSNPAQPAQPGTPPPAGGYSSSTPGTLFTTSHEQQMNTPYSPAAIAMGMNVGDIWSNPAFANAMALQAQQNGPGGSIFGGPNSQPTAVQADPAAMAYRQQLAAQGATGQAAPMDQSQIGGSAWGEQIRRMMSGG